MGSAVAYKRSGRDVFGRCRDGRQAMGSAMVLTLLLMMTAENAETSVHPMIAAKT